MASVPLTPVAVTPAANTWTPLDSAVTSAKVRAVDVRVTNIHASADCNVKVRLNNGSVTKDRAGTIPLPCNSPDSAKDMERKLIIPATWFVEVWCSAGSNATFTQTGWEDDV